MNVVIADEDQGYAEGLLRFIRTSEWAGRMQPAIFTEVEAFCDCSESLGGSLVLASSSFLPFTGQLASCCVLHLSDNSGAANQNRGDYPEIFKFQPLQQLLTEASGYFGQYGDTTAVPAVGASSCPAIIAVYSASGGSGKTKVAGMLLSHLAELGGNVLGVNMESIPEDTDDGNDRPTLQRLLFAVREKRSPEAVMQRFIRQGSAGKIHVLPPSRYSDEWEEYTREDVAAFIRLLRDSGEYRSIVIDLDCALSARTVEVINQADRIVWLTPEHRTGVSKARYAIRSLRRLSEQQFDAIHARILNIAVPGISFLEDDHSPDFHHFSQSVLHIVSKLDKGAEHDKREPLH